jgi:glycosyltransferase involved in cell wall biosynthesis
MNDKIKDLKDYNAIKTDAFAAFRRGELEKALNYIHVAAAIAWKHPLGFWYDQDLDNLLQQIGRSFQSSELTVKKTEKTNHQKIVYIATNILDAGGCPEVLMQWSQLLKTDFEKQILYVTHSYTSNIPIRYSKDFFDGTGIYVHNFSYQDKNTERISELIKFLNEDSPDFIALFIEPNDVIAVPAIHALHDKPKVIYFNHADHAFWLGRTVIDYLIDLRSWGAELSKKFRNIDNSYIIPLTTDIKPQKSSREEWNIKKDSTISISVGGFHKVLGDDHINYFHVIEELLEKFPNHYHLFITNPPSQDFAESYITNDSDIRERFIITGPFSDLSPIYGLGDFLIETIPLIGGTVRIEAMACKLPIVAFDMKRWSQSENMFLPLNYPFIGSTKNEIINYSSELIKHPQLRRKCGEHLYNHYYQEFSPKKIHESLRNIITNKFDDSIIKNIAPPPAYEDMKYAQIWFRDDLETYKNLLLESIFKRSTFSFNERIEFYSKALKRKEFKSKNYALMYAILSVIGWRGQFILKKVFKYN